MATPEHVDVLIIGAGLSGIGAACQVKTAHPGRSIAILEGRSVSGGTWDLFRYPGVRSDSDMFTFGYRWRPWPSDTALADGELILNYVRTVAEENGVDELIRYDHRVVAAAFDSATGRWTVTADHDGETVTLTASFLWGATGYYDYDEPHDAHFPGIDDFGGTVVHPQFWPEDLDYAGKRVVVIGSGATAVTLVPSMAPTAGHVTMLQRTPTYIIPQPATDPLAKLLGPVPDAIKYPVVRWKNVLQLVGSYQLSRKFPTRMKKVFRKLSEGHLPEHVKYDDHFKPPYDPWDQRLCVVPHGDLFKVLREGNASIVTDHIETFTETGIRLRSGEELEADVVVTATGLKLKLFGGVDLSVDGEPFVAGDSMAYKGLMLTGVPNFAYTIGYTNASWTLKADLVSEFFCRVINYMDDHGYDTVEPTHPGNSVDERPLMDFTPGYVLRALDYLPKSGSRAPWRLKQNYLLDLQLIRRGKVDDEALAFSRHRAPVNSTSA